MKADDFGAVMGVILFVVGAVALLLLLVAGYATNQAEALCAFEVMQELGLDEDLALKICQR